MKIEFREFGSEVVEINLVPEDAEDFAKLLRFSKNCSAEKPRVFFYFEKSISCSINLKKYKKSVQKNSITPYNR
jgi:hypothetical protein